VLKNIPKPNPTHLKSYRSCVDHLHGYLHFTNGMLHVKK
jgi:hypothetical protein